MSRLLNYSQESAAPALLAMFFVGGILSPASAELRHNYLFNSGNGIEILDSAGAAHGSAINGASVAVSDSRLVLDGIDGYGALPGATIAVNTFNEVSLEMWLTPSTTNTGFTAAAHLGRTSDGSNEEQANLGYDYLMLQPTRGAAGEGSRGALSNGTYDAEVGVTDGARNLNDGQLHHVVLTVDATDVGYYVDGAQIGVAPLGDFSLANVSNELAYLGRSLYPDPYLAASVYEFRIFDNALTDVEVSSRFSAGCLDNCGDPLRFEIDRDTGVGTFVNDLASQNIVAYSISSAAGAIDTVNWASVADNGDLDSGGAIDPDDVWSVTTSTNVLVEETDPIGGGGPDNGFQVGQPASLGAVWTRSRFEDLVVSVTTFDGINEVVSNVPVRYAGNGGVAFSRSDLDLDGDIDGDDYGLLNANHLTPLGGATAIDTFALGDIDGDLDNDFNDYRLFKNDYIAANGLAAFQALSAIPEPSTAALALLAVVAFRCKQR